jgi:V8-like Glu-specific endopeptidase
MDIDMDIFTFTSGGRPTKGTGAVFPICEQMPDETIKYLGTGFFVSSNGIFVTAKHVIEGSISPFALHFRPNNEVVFRPIVRADLSHRGDLAIGVIAEMMNSAGEILTNERLTLSSYIPQITEVVSTYAYPESTVESGDVDGQQGNILKMDAHQYHGVVAKVEMNGIGHITPSPAFLCTIHSLPGISGGPVFSKRSNGGVIGVNSYGMTGVYHVVSLIEELKDLTIDGINFQNEYKPTSLTVDELIKLDLISYR